MPRSDRCINPYGYKPHMGTRTTLRRISKSIRRKFPNLSLESKICGNCRKKEPDGSGINRSQSNSPLPDNDTMEIEAFPENDVHNDEQEVESESETPKSDREIELEDLLTGLKDKFSSLDRCDPLRLRILTIAPASWSARKIEREFGASRHLAQKAKNLRELGGVLAPTTAKTGNILPKDTAEKIKEFYESDLNSKILPGIKDVVSENIDGERTKVQKRLLLLDLNGLYASFKETYPDENVSFSVFAKLRLKHCILAGARGTHTVCVCTIHENCKLMLDPINLSKLTDGRICNYKDCLSKLMCKKPNSDCHLNNCKNCPDIADFASYLVNLLNDNSITDIEFSSWTGTDRSTLQTVTLEVDDYVEELCSKLVLLKSHSFISKQQSQFISEKKLQISENEAFVGFDFSQNFCYVAQNASQAFHFNNDQCTVFPVIFYYKQGSELKHESCVFLSDSLKHDTAAVYTIQNQLIPILKKRVKNLRKIIYVTDGAKQHFKNKFQMANLLNHKFDFGIEAEWHYSATAHGKSSYDGIGATFKREAYRCSLLAKPAQAMLTIGALVNWAKKHFETINIFYFTKTEHDKMQRKLNKRFEEAKPVTGILSHHAFMVLPRNTLFMKTHSKSTSGRKIIM